MSDNKNNPQNDTKSDLETRLADAKATAESLLNKRKAVVVSEENVVDVATTRSGVDIVLWLIAISALISSTLFATLLGTCHRVNHSAAYHGRTCAVGGDLPCLYPSRTSL